VPCTFRNWLRFERTRSRTCSKLLIFVKNPWSLPSRPFFKEWDSTPTFKVNQTPAPVHTLQFEFLKHPKLAVLKTPYPRSFDIWKKSYKQIWQVLQKVNTHPTFTHPMLVQTNICESISVTKLRQNWGFPWNKWTTDFVRNKQKFPNKNWTISAKDHSENG
jgi:hypothetical protein